MGLVLGFSIGSCFAVSLFRCFAVSYKRMEEKDVMPDRTLLFDFLQQKEEKDVTPDRTLLLGFL